MTRDTCEVVLTARRDGQRLGSSVAEQWFAKIACRGFESRPSHFNTHQQRRGRRGMNMTRIEAIARLRELADRLEGFPDCERVTFTNNLLIFANESSEHDAFATLARSKFDAHEYTAFSTGRGCYSNRDSTATVYVRLDYCATDLLANRDVQVLEIGGAA